MDPLEINSNVKRTFADEKKIIFELTALNSYSLSVLVSQANQMGREKKTIKSVDFYAKEKTVEVVYHYEK